MMNKKNILISGAGGYLGSNICYLFSRLNYNIICLEINKNKLSLLKKRLNKFKNKKHFFPVDITNEKKVLSISNYLKK